MVELLVRTVGAELLSALAGDLVRRRLGHRTPSRKAAICSNCRTSLQPIQQTGHEIRSSTPGRVRLRVESLRGRAALAQRTADELSTLAGVIEVRSNSLTGTILATFDPQRLSDREVLAAVLAITDGRTTQTSHLRLVASNG